MLITIRAANAASGQVAQVQKQLQALNRQQMMAAAGAQGFGRSLRGGHLERYGKNLQWTGRQIEFNFTLPILAAGAAATIWANRTEAAFTRLSKVYGDLRPEMQGIYKEELPQLRRAFMALSDIFGVHADEVMEIAGSWAAAGASGIALAKATRATLEAMIIGDMEAVAATEALIAIQAQYQLNTEELTAALATMNIVENQTAIGFQGLVQGFQRAAGTARTAGVSVRELAALLAAMVPAAGSAAQAGNALRTMLSRILAPTGDAADIMQMMGLNIKDASWQALDGAERIQKMAVAFDNLSDSQKAQASALIASRYQITRFDTLMRDILNPMGYFQQALEATDDLLDPVTGAINRQSKAWLTYQKEIGVFLSSSPQAFKILQTQMMNTMAQAMMPMIPAILGVMSRVRDLIKAFTDLHPSIQQLIVAGLLFIAVIGPLARYAGATFLLISKLGGGFSLLGGAVMKSGQFLGIFQRRLELANGQILLYRSGLLTWGATLLRMPFSAVAAGFGLIYRSLLWALNPGTWAAMMSGLTAVFAWMPGAAAAASSKMLVIWRAMSALATGIFMRLPIQIAGPLALAWDKVALLVSGVWRAAWLRIQMLWIMMPKSALGLRVALVQVWSKIAALSAAAWTIFTNIVSGIWFMLQVVAFRLAAPLAGVWARIATASGNAWSAFSFLVQAIWARLPALLAPIGAVITAAWATVATAAGNAWSAFSFLTAAIWARMPAVVTTVGGLIGAAWSAAAAWSALVWRNFTVAVQMLWVTMPKSALGLRIAFNQAWALIAAGSVGIWRAAMTAIQFLWASLPAFISAIGPAVSLAATAVGVAAVSAFEAAIAAAPYVLAAAVVVGLIYFRDEVADFVKRVGDQFNRLPASVLGAMSSVIRILQKAAEQAVKWLSYLNPFARHSPSLVEQVEAGVNVIASSYARLSNIGSVFTDAIRALEGFKGATAGALATLEALDRAEMRADLIKIAPDAGDEFDALVAHIEKLKPTLQAVAREWADQKLVVDNLEVALTAANDQLDAAKNHLDQLKDAADAAKNELDAAKDLLDEYANMDITGMRQMEDAIFSNEMAQKGLRLEILRLEEAGQTVEDLEDKMARLAGDIESLRGEREDLRLAGAGSDVLGMYDQQIAAMEEQQRVIQNTTLPINELTKQLETLQRQGEILDLENSLAFDPLTRQIEQAVTGLKEMPFEEILAGVNTQRGEVDRLTGVWETATAAVNDQQGVVDTLTAARDLLSGRLDTEKDKLTALGETYDALEQQIRAMESALNDMGSAASAANQAGSHAEEMWAAGAGMDFEDTAGSGQIGREEGDIAKLADEWAKEAEKTFGSFDMFGPIKDQFKAAWNWIKEQVAPVVAPVIDAIKGMFGGIDWGAAGGGIAGGAGSIWEGIKSGADSVAGYFTTGPMKPALDWLVSTFETVFGLLRQIWNLFGDEIFRVVDLIIDFIVDLIVAIWDEMKNWEDVWRLAGEVVSSLATVIAGVFKVIAVIVGAGIMVVVGIFRMLWPILIHVLKPIFDMIVGVIRAALEIIRGVITFVLALITGEWGTAWNAILTVVDGIWDAIYSVISGFIGIIIGIVRGLIEGIIGFFQWLWDTLVGNSIVPDLVDKIIFLFNLLTAPIRAVWDGIVWVINNVVAPAFRWIYESVIKPMMEGIGNTISWVWNNLMLPVFNAIKWTLENVVAPVFSWIKDNVILPVWEGIKTGISGVWENGIKPIFNGIKSFVENVLMPIWDTLKGAILGAFDGVKNAIGGIWDGIKSAIKGGVNFAIDVVNTLIDGLNTIAGILPGVDWKIPFVPKIGDEGSQHGFFARGGITNGITAIVGEGNPRYPEFVIPTDPRYRERAESLFKMLGGQLGIPQMGLGGWIADRAGDVAGVVGDVVGAVRKGAVTAAFQPFLAATDALIRLIPWDKGRDMMNAMKNNVYNWVKGEDIKGAYNGAIIRGSREGVLIRAGERNRNELISPLPSGEMGTKEYHFHGDLSFPNVKNGNDAEAFIANLERLVG